MGRRRVSSLIVAATGALACGEIPEPPATSTRAEPIQRGVILPPKESLAAGVVQTSALATKKLNEACSGTMIGPRLLLTAEHCVRDYDRASATWGSLKKTLKVSVPGAFGDPALWAASECAISAGTVGDPTGTAQGPSFQVARPFNVGLKVLPQVKQRRLVQTVFPRCDVATLSSPQADVAVVRLAAGTRRHPSLEMGLVLDGLASAKYTDTGALVRCAGYGKDVDHAANVAEAGVAKTGDVRLVSKRPVGGDVAPPGSVFLVPGMLGADGYGSLPDAGDSGGPCFVETDSGSRRIVSLATESVPGAPPPGQPPRAIYAEAARTESFLPWLERAAFTHPDAFRSRVDTVIPLAAVPERDFAWDDGRNLFMDLNGDGFDDFVYFGDPNNFYLQLAAGNGTFGAPGAPIPLPHLRDFTREAKWKGSSTGTPPKGGHISRLVVVSPNPDSAYPGLSIGAYIQQGTSPSFLPKLLAGKAWEDVRAVEVGIHFDPKAEALAVRRAPDPQVPGDAGEIALVQTEPNGSFDVLQAKTWKIPAAYIARAFSFADVDGDGGADLVFASGSSSLHVFAAVPGGTWSTSPTVSLGLGGCGFAEDRPPPLVDVTGDQRADLACITNESIRIFPGQATRDFVADIVSPFEITDREWVGGSFIDSAGVTRPSSGLLQDLDGDGYRDYIVFHSGALWFKMNNGPAVTGGPRAGTFDVVQRFQLPDGMTSASLSRSFDAPRLRLDAARSVAVVVSQAGGKGAIWELASDARPDR